MVSGSCFNDYSGVVLVCFITVLRQSSTFEQSFVWCYDYDYELRLDEHSFVSDYT